MWSIQLHLSNISDVKALKTSVYYAEKQLRTMTSKASYIFVQLFNIKQMIHHHSCQQYCDVTQVGARTSSTSRKANRKTGKKQKCHLYLIACIQSSLSSAVCAYILYTVCLPTKQQHDRLIIVTATSLISFTNSFCIHLWHLLPAFCLFFFHHIALHFISCLVLFCCTVYYCLFSFLIFSLLATSSIKLNQNL